MNKYRKYVKLFPVLILLFSGEYAVGRQGNGYAKITYIEE